MLSRRLGLLMLSVLPAACTSPNPMLYVLAPMPGVARTGAPRVIELRGINTAHYLERAQIVRSSEGYRLDVLANDWWGEPLGALLGRVLVEDLNQRLPGSMVYADSGAIAMRADATVEINLQRFDLNRDNALLLVAQIAVERKRVTSRGVSFTVRPANATTAALVAAMSTATAQLADAIAVMLTER